MKLFVCTFLITSKVEYTVRLIYKLQVLLGEYFVPALSSVRGMVNAFLINLFELFIHKRQHHLFMYIANIFFLDLFPVLAHVYRGIVRLIHWQVDSF